jgi:hypothetical protein
MPAPKHLHACVCGACVQVLLDRYQAARHNVLVLGAIQQIEAKTKNNTHRSGKSKPGSGSVCHARCRQWSAQHTMMMSLCRRMTVSTTAHIAAVLHDSKLL